MDIRSVLLTPRGRIGENDFWRGVIVLTATQIIITVLSALGPGALGALGMLVTLSLIYPYFCTYVKRLHDSGRSASYFFGCCVAAFFVSMFSNYVLLSVFVGDVGAYYEDVLGAIEAGDARTSEALALQSLMPSLISILLVNGIVGLIPAKLPADQGDNEHGPPTGRSS